MGSPPHANGEIPALHAEAAEARELAKGFKNRAARRDLENYAFALENGHREEEENHERRTANGPTG